MKLTEDSRWVVFRQDPKVSVHLVPVSQIPSFIASHRGIVGVYETRAAAISARHDAAFRCNSCSGGKGRYRCGSCQERSLIEDLGASVAVASVQRQLRDSLGRSHERDLAGGHRAALAQKLGGR